MKTMTNLQAMGITEEILGEIERAGWKLVPMEPTPEMLAATSWPGCAGADYAKMISAAPAEPDELRARCDGGTCGLGGVCENCMMADAIELAAEQPDTGAAPPELYTCIGKGGTYELIGKSQGAGEMKHQQIVVYRSAETGLLFHRTLDDFDSRMTPLAGGDA